MSRRATQLRYGMASIAEPEDSRREKHLYRTDTERRQLVRRLHPSELTIISSHGEITRQDESICDDFSC